MANSRFAAGAAIGSVMAMLLLTGPAHAAAKDYRFEVVQAQPAGKNLTDLAVKLTHITDGKPVTGAVIFQTKADMGPSGMDEMTGKVTPQPADPSGLYHFRRPAWPAPGRSLWRPRSRVNRKRYAAKLSSR